MSETAIFTPAVSSEDETRPMFWINVGDGYEPLEIKSELIMSAIRDSSEAIVGTQFMLNGGKIYDDTKGPEFAKPECTNPYELATYTIAMDQAYLEVLTEYAKRLAGTSGDVAAMVRLHRRVIDAKFNTWACHDNISIPKALGERLVATSTANEKPRGAEAALLVKHLMWRSFLSGAGLVTPDGLRYAQKVDSVKGYNQYGFLSSYFRVETAEGPRLEARCSDRNLNNAAAVMRVGGTAIVAALMQVPYLRDVLNSRGQLANPSPQGRDYNGLDLMPDGTIKPSTALIEAVDGEQQIAEFAAARLPKYMDVPRAYLDIAALQYGFCDDFRRVMAGEATVDLLSDRSDWARKAQLLLEYVAADPGQRTTLDNGARSVDMNYDATTIIARGGKAAAKHGQGARDQLNTDLPCTPDADSITVARTTPPNTRAADRVQKLLKAKGSFAADWQMLTYGGRNDVFYPTYVY